MNVLSELDLRNKCFKCFVKIQMSFTFFKQVSFYKCQNLYDFLLVLNFISDMIRSLITVQEYYPSSNISTYHLWNVIYFIQNENTIYTKMKLKYNIFCWYKSKKYQWNLRIRLNKLNNKYLDLNHGTYPLRLDLNEKRYWSSTFLLSKHLRALDAFYSVQNYILFTEIALKI